MSLLSPEPVNHPTQSRLSASRIKVIYRILLAAFFVLVTGYASRGTAEIPETKVYLDDKNILYFEGYISATSSQKLFDLYASTQDKPQLLVINSGGGSINAGMDMGDWIFHKGMSVEVAEKCKSSCANYIFTAARQKILRKDSLLMWHGSAWQKNFDRYANSTSQETNEKKILSELIRSGRKRESAFFDKIDVDNLTTVYGQGTLTFMDVIKAIFQSPWSGFDYSIEDMNRLGIKNIVLADDEWDWRKYWGKKSGKRVKRAQLDSSYQFMKSRFLLTN